MSYFHKIANFAVITEQFVVLRCNYCIINYTVLRTITFIWLRHPE